MPKLPTATGAQLHQPPECDAGNQRTQAHDGAPREARVSLTDVIASMRANPPVRRGPACTAGAAIRTLTDEDQRAIYGAADEIAARNSALTWKDLARLVHDETGLDVNWERMSRHCRRECACRR